MHLMETNKRFWIIASVILLLVIGYFGFGYFSKSPTVTGSFGAVPISGASNAEVLAKCLTEKGAKLYGASWCPHCKDQKEKFGDAIQFVNYVECADSSDPYKQAKACADADIQGYPTWVRADNERVSGSKTLEFLAEWADCQ